MSCCPHRCDIEFDYGVNTDLNLSLLSSEPIYILNAGDTISFTLNSDKIKNPQDVSNVKVVSAKNGTLELTSSDNLTWSGTIPSTWNTQDTFSVNITYGKDIQLWQGLLNATESSITTTNSATFDLTGEIIYIDNEGKAISSTKENLLDDIKQVVKDFKVDTIVIENATLTNESSNLSYYNYFAVLYRQIKYRIDEEEVKYIAYAYANHTNSGVNLTIQDTTETFDLVLLPS